MAQVIYDRLEGAEPVGVNVVFSERAEKVHFEMLTNSLATFVRAHQGSKGPGYYEDLPEGYFYIGIHEPAVPPGRWHSGGAFDTVLASRELLESCIAEKDQRVQDYRLSASTVWLLIVNDLFLGAGEVYARPDRLADWTFTFGFNKVLLFSRQPGGGGDVIEIQRAP